MADVKELFETFDADGSGRISTQEVAGLLAKLGAPKPAAAPDHPGRPSMGSAHLGSTGERPVQGHHAVPDSPDLCKAGS